MAERSQLIQHLEVTPPLLHPLALALPLLSLLVDRVRRLLRREHVQARRHLRPDLRLRLLLRTRVRGHTSAASPTEPYTPRRGDHGVERRRAGHVRVQVVCARHRRFRRRWESTSALDHELAACAGHGRRACGRTRSDGPLRWGLPRAAASAQLEVHLQRTCETAKGGTSALMPGGTLARGGG